MRKVRHHHFAVRNAAMDVASILNQAMLALAGVL
jgi:hypothetical protein